MAQSISGATVAAALERTIARHEQPTSITVDHGTEFTSRALERGPMGAVWHSISSGPESLPETAKSSRSNGAQVAFGVACEYCNDPPLEVGTEPTKPSLQAGSA